MSTRMTISEFQKQDVKGRLLDVRTEAEYAQSYLPEAELIPVDQLATKIEKASFKRDEPLYIMCQSGKRAEHAAEQLELLGYQYCYIIEGGMNAWSGAGHPCLKRRMRRS